MWFRLIFLGLLAIGLAGCALKTRTPLFADADARLLLADYPNPAAYERDEGGWTKSEEQIGFTPEASHYLVTPDTSKMQIFFVPLEGPWWILQAVEPAGSTTYLLAKAKAKELLFYPLDCKSLEDSGKYGDAIDFEDLSCFIKTGTDTMALFKSFTADLTEPSTKLLSEP